VDPGSQLARGEPRSLGEDPGDQIDGGVVRQRSDALDDDPGLTQTDPPFVEQGVDLGEPGQIDGEVDFGLGGTPRETMGCRDLRGHQVSIIGEHSQQCGDVGVVLRLMMGDHGGVGQRRLDQSVSPLVGSQTVILDR